MDNSHTRVTVQRIEKIPARYYVQETKPQSTNKKQKIEINTSLMTERKRLSDALRSRPAIGTDFSGTKVAFWKALGTRALEKTLGTFKNLRYYLLENAKRLLFSGMVSAGVAASACIVLACTCSLAYTVTINGRTLGTVQNEAVYHQLLEDIQTEVSYVTDEAFVPGGAPEFSGRLIPKGAFTPAEEMKENIKSTSREMLPAYGVYAGGEILFSLPNKQSALSVLEAYKNSFIDGKDNVTADFCQEVAVSYRFVPKASLKTPESATKALRDGRVETHYLKEGEALSDVAAAYGITVHDILATNPISDVEKPGVSTLSIYTGEPLLSIKTVELVNFNESIPFKTIEKEDPTKYEGNLIVEQAGAPGEKAVKAYVTCINGVETERDVISEDLLCASVDEIVTKGTKEPPSPIGTGDFVVPASGSLSSRFGSRWGRSHKGIDLAAPTGTDIYAADNGRVIYSQYNDGGFGYMLQIDHGNGIITYYAHCSELLVPAGSVVAKGDLVARVGNTGRSTGAHLHFEVHKNGTPIDPLTYLTTLG
ncbi:MAG: M23 family metallopeptidase [Ruminococcaceae bacterium]|nr:M23 family metallopeptidase [Oscillospiraceae bacterium]